MFDMVEFKEILRNSILFLEGEYNFVEYLEEIVDDGFDILRIFFLIVSVFDLFVVGRSLGMGIDVMRVLSEWMEFDELGVIGDLLVLLDFF